MPRDNKAVKDTSNYLLTYVCLSVR